MQNTVNTLEVSEVTDDVSIEGVLNQVQTTVYFSIDKNTPGMWKKTSSRISAVSQEHLLFSVVKLVK